MPRYNYKWNVEKIKRYIKERRGQGEFEHYLPWLTERDVPSTGRIARIPLVCNGLSVFIFHGNDLSEQELIPPKHWGD